MLSNHSHGPEYSLDISFISLRLSLYTSTCLIIVRYTTCLIFRLIFLVKCLCLWSLLFPLFHHNLSSFYLFKTCLYYLPKYWTFIVLLSDNTTTTLLVCLWFLLIHLLVFYSPDCRAFLHYFSYRCPLLLLSDLGASSFY